MTSIRTTIGGALSALGTALMGVGIIPQLQGAPSPMLTNIALTGFVCSALGQFFAHLFAADAKQQRQNTEAIEQLKCDTQSISKP